MNALDSGSGNHGVPDRVCDHWQVSHRLSCELGKRFGSLYRANSSISGPDTEESRVLCDSNQSIQKAHAG